MSIIRARALTFYEYQYLSRYIPSISVDWWIRDERRNPFVLESALLVKESGVKQAELGMAGFVRPILFFDEQYGRFALRDSVEYRGFSWTAFANDALILNQPLKLLRWATDGTGDAFATCDELDRWIENWAQENGLTHQ